MSNGPKIYEVKCPSCGAPVSMTGERMTCDYCGAVLEREQPAAPEQAPSSKTQEPHVVVIQTGYSTLSSQRKSGGSSCLSVLFTLVLLVVIFGAVGWFLLRAQVPALASLTDLSSQLADLSQLPQQIANTVSVSSLSRVILLPNGGNTPPDFLTYVYKNDAQTYALTYVDALSSTIRWQSPPLKEWYSAQVLPSRERAVAHSTSAAPSRRSVHQASWSAAPSSSANCPSLQPSTMAWSSGHTASVLAVRHSCRAATGRPCVSGTAGDLESDKHMKISDIPPMMAVGARQESGRHAESRLLTCLCTAGAVW